MPPPTSPPTPTVATHLQSYLISPATYLSTSVSTSTSPPSKVSHLITSAAVINPASKRILLLQRTARDFLPLLWELPGGSCESSDTTVIASAIRELTEETGLVASEVKNVVGWYEWVIKGEIARKVGFLVEVESEGDEEPRVEIDVEEHERYMWATEEEVMADKCGEVDLRWTSQEKKEMVLKAFQVFK